MIIASPMQHCGPLEHPIRASHPSGQTQQIAIARVGVGDRVLHGATQGFTATMVLTFATFEQISYTTLAPPAEVVLPLQTAAQHAQHLHDYTQVLQRRLPQAAPRPEPGGRAIPLTPLPAPMLGCVVAYPLAAQGLRIEAAYTIEEMLRICAALYAVEQRHRTIVATLRALYEQPTR